MSQQHFPHDGSGDPQSGRHPERPAGSQPRVFPYGDVPRSDEPGPQYGQPSEQGAPQHSAPQYDAPRYGEPSETQPGPYGAPVQQGAPEDYGQPGAGPDRGAQDPRSPYTQVQPASDPVAPVGGEVETGGAGRPAAQAPGTGLPREQGFQGILDPHTGEVHPVPDLNKLNDTDALLVVVSGPDAGAQILLDTDLVTVGRSPNADIFLDDVTVSRKHAEFVRTPAGFTLRDTGSLNGTYVGRQLIDSIELQNGADVQIGKFRMIFQQRPRTN